MCSFNSVHKCRVPPCAPWRTILHKYRQSFLFCGAVFGPFYSGLYAVIRAEIGAIGCFLLARAMGRDALSKLIGTEATFASCAPITNIWDWCSPRGSSPSFHVTWPATSGVEPASVTNPPGRRKIPPPIRCTGCGSLCRSVLPTFVLADCPLVAAISHPMLDSFDL